MDSTVAMVCAVDFGTTYTSYAYSFKENPTAIFCPYWKDLADLVSDKTPTSMLLDKQHQFVAFGYEAERKYLDLVKDGNAKDFFYFKSFKMPLYDKIRIEVSISLKPLCLIDIKTGK